MSKSSKSSSTIPLREYWIGISEDPKERARKMRGMCAKAGITYEHLKHVINRRRRLGIDAASKLVKQSGGRIDINDLIFTSDKIRK